ncbi:protein-L-isoaspartate(D-aspartate) O-methyltransferase [Thraustotheca clavata]|uniref:protein-L-isoaspartate(D-aspartate) O-methyltransferase n=1 Tax=Thraustotheca clavata TaxID=74557 RepID=A0A1V9Z155_9STRA|nr:protein-L-isoaspartate(D-aspartate) O-methyltransferase [Thraustotheca clavata]
MVMLFRASAVHRVLRRSFSVLNGMSDDLLISMNMGHSIGGTSQRSLVDSLIKAGVLNTPRVQEAFHSLDRGDFLLQAVAPEEAYANRPIKIGTIATISTSQQHAQVIELLESHLQPGNSAIDVGCGSGYLTAVMAHLVGESGSVTGVDIVPSLIELSTKNIAKTKLPKNSIKWETSQGKQILRPGTSFDCIHVGVAVESMEAVDAIAAQLNPNGGLVVALGYAGAEQTLLKVTKSASGELTKRAVMSVLCQPLLDEAPLPLALPETRTEKLQRLQSELEAWKNDFTAKHGHNPTREDMLKDPLSKQLFSEFAALRK